MTLTFKDPPERLYPGWARTIQELIDDGSGRWALARTDIPKKKLSNTVGSLRVAARNAGVKINVQQHHQDDDTYHVYVRLAPQ